MELSAPYTRKEWTGYREVFKTAEKTHSSTVLWVNPSPIQIDATA